MKVNKAQLVDTLNSVTPAIDQKGDEQLINRVVFTGVDIAGYNEHICMVHPFETDFATAVPANELLALLKKYKGKEVDLVYSNNNLNIKGGSKLKARLVTNPEHPNLIAVQELINVADANLQWAPVPEDFTNAIKLCMYSASTDPTQGHLKCVYVNGAMVVGSDDFRISEYTMQSGIDDQLMIPATACMAMVKLGTINQYALNNAWGFFLTEANAMVITRLVAEPYDDHTQFFTIENGTGVHLPAEKIVSEIDTASVMSDGDLDIEKTVRVHIENGQIKIKGEKALGFSETHVVDERIKLTGNAAFSINPSFFADVLERTNHVVVSLDKALFQSDEGNFKHLISLSPTP